MDGIDTLTLVGSDPSGGNGFMIDYFTYNTNPVPLPSAVLLLGPGIAGLAAIRRRFTK
jgi:hypothetical protein